MWTERPDLSKAMGIAAFLLCCLFLLAIIVK